MLAKTVGVTRFCYNWGLKRWNEMHQRGEHCDRYLLSRLWTDERPEWAKEVSRQPQTKTLLDLGGAFSAFFKGRTEHPNFHKKGKHDSFYVNNVQAFLKDNRHVHLPNIGDVRMAEELRFKGKILRFVVSREAYEWYVSISVELEDEIAPTDSETVVGIDVGSVHWATASDGGVLDVPKAIPKLNRKLKQAQRALSRKRKGSRNRRKARVKVARLYQKIRNSKMDAVHKFTTAIAKNHGIVCCENLCVKGMQRGAKGFRKAVQNSCMAELRTTLSYKAKHYVEIDRWDPSSKTCSNCGRYMADLDAKQRTYRCPECGLVMDRDLNAAINIREWGKRIFTEGHSGSACG